MTEADVRELFAPVTPVTVRRMFGGLGVYGEAGIFALVAHGELFMKVDGETRDAFEAAGSTPFVYDGSGKTVTMPYMRLPAEAFDDEERLVAFTRLALAAAARAPARPRRSARGAR
ncbi:TfoX/Sxy family protein [Acuticoccus mangrovi]|uniref:TfoX/Sxy family protein n=1 Tax=Acuticoccus mangrovi TaxID=2796142 RepID=A0A934IK27_9HYPH|nr:TfoX/Sxy family protein [Acuticoccus mangrovi]MBJ3777933.1 TfoX/Sxy family protein [Acuticoccus mangrovi]